MTKADARPEIVRLGAAEATARIDALSDLLRRCVEAGASINFVLPFDAAAAEAFWRRKALPPIADGVRALWIAQDAGRIVGSVQLDWGTPPNQPHRAEVTKLMVRPDQRRRGIARALMGALEAEAARLGRTLITLDTRSGDSAEPLYASMGYVAIGAIPGFSVDPLDPTKLDATTLMYKTL